MWTSTAQVADRILLLTRTTPREKCRRSTNGLTLFYTGLDRDRVEVREIPKMGRASVDSNALFIDGLRVPEEDRIGEEGDGFRLLLHSLNPERVLVAVEAVGIGRQALARAARYAKERVVFDRPIGQNQGVAHPLARSWIELEAVWLMAMRAAWTHDHGLPAGAHANAAKYFAGEIDNPPWPFDQLPVGEDIHRSQLGNDATAFRQCGECPAALLQPRERDEGARRIFLGDELDDSFKVEPRCVRPQDPEISHPWWLLHAP